jgi:predicted nucleic acid-binding protein
VCDGLYIALARDQHARLATADSPLRRAALRFEVALWEP